MKMLRLMLPFVFVSVSMAAELCSQIRNAETCVQFFKLPYALLASVGLYVPANRIDWSAYQVFARTTSPEVTAFRVSIEYRVGDAWRTQRKYMDRSREPAHDGRDMQSGTYFDLPPGAEDIRVAVADLIVSEVERFYDWR